MDETPHSAAEFTFGRSFKIFLSFGWRGLVAGILFDLPLVLFMGFFIGRLGMNVMDNSGLDRAFGFMWVFPVMLFIKFAGDILISMVIMKIVLKLSYSDFSIAFLPKEDLMVNKIEVTWSRALKVWWSMAWRTGLIGLLFFLPLLFVVNALKLPRQIINILALISSPFIFYYVFDVILDINYADFNVRILEKV